MRSGKKGILIISGLHGNEGCARIMADMVYEKLSYSSNCIRRMRIPKRDTLVGGIDVFDRIQNQYWIDKKKKILDVDLDGVFSDAQIHERYPNDITFEFHNYPDTFHGEKLRVPGDKNVRDYSIGDVGPFGSGGHEIGYWRNRPSGNVPGKYLIEVPAVYRAVSYERIQKRFQNLAKLKTLGYDFERGREIVEIPYLIQDTDTRKSRAKGYLSETIVNKVVKFIKTAVNGS